MNTTTITYETLYDVAQDCISLMNEHGLSPLKWSFQWSNKKTAFGTCHYKRSIGIGHVKLSRVLCELNLDNVEQIRDTILHEIAHALEIDQYGSTSHGPRWKAIARSIGCNAERCFDSEEVETPTYKYTLVCPNCGREVGYHRRPKTNKACGDCCRKYNNGRYTDKFKFQLKY